MASSGIEVASSDDDNPGVPLAEDAVDIPFDAQQVDAERDGSAAHLTRDDTARGEGVRTAKLKAGSGVAAPVATSAARGPGFVKQLSGAAAADSTAQQQQPEQAASQAQRGVAGMGTGMGMGDMLVQDMEAELGALAAPEPAMEVRYCPVGHGLGCCQACVQSRRATFGQRVQLQLSALSKTRLARGRCSTVCPCRNAILTW